MIKRQWTQQQNNAIYARGGSLLVSAAAGSGKTAVLVERVIEYITDKDNPCDIDRLLVVTFSNAAAAEMKERIGKRLHELIKKQRDNKHLRRQLMLLSNADISTIHSFCMKLAKEHFDELKISTDFRIADDNELKVIRSECLNEVVDEFYKNADSEFYELVELLSNGRNDANLFAVIETIYNFICSQPFRTEWMEQKLSMYRKTDDPGKSDWGRSLYNIAKQMAEYALIITNNNIERITGLTPLEEAFMSGLQGDREILSNLIELIKNGTYEEIVSYVREIKLPRLSSVRKFEDTEFKDYILRNRNEVKEILSEIRKNLFCIDAQDYNSDIEYFHPKVKILFNMVLSFSEKYEEQKQARNIADFDDLEQYAIRLLINKTDSGYEKTKLAQELSNSYSEILIDEFQDTNETQELIFKAISKNESNLFMVGDVKQSIYSFRKAKPQIFIKKKNSYYDYDGVNYPARLMLTNNFRSRRQVTEIINFLFSQIMSADFGEIDYDETESLTPSGSFCQYDKGATEIHIVDSSEKSGDDRVTKEAKYIAQYIVDMVNNKHMVSDGEGLRPCRFGDFCILMRATKNKSEKYISALCDYGINVSAEVSVDFFKAKEIKMIMSYLNAIDNPMNDMHIISVLMSPIYRFTADDIAYIKKYDKTARFYNSLLKLSKENEKYKAFTDSFSALRNNIFTMSVDKAIEAIYDNTGLEHIVKAMSGGELRRRNLELFLGYARRYSTLGYKGLYGFLRFIEKVAKKDNNIGSNTTGYEDENAVKIMSIHHSKGLEFPICILADFDKAFNQSDLRNTVLLHEQLGIGCSRGDSDSSVLYQTMQKASIKMQLQRSIISEELRVLYVAMTRAKDKLAIIITTDNLENKMNKLSLAVYDGDRILPSSLMLAKSYGDMILMAALRHPDAVELRDICKYTDIKPIECNENLKIIISKPSAVTDNKNEQPVEKCEETKYDEQLLGRIKALATLSDNAEQHSGIPIKLSVSDIVSKNIDKGYSDFKKPTLASGFALTPAQRGTALHKFMQFADFNKAEISVEAEINRLVVKRYITKKEADSINVSNLRKFFLTDLYSNIKSSDKVLREYRFLSLVDSSSIEAFSEIYKNEEVVVQGVIDCIYFKGNDVVIVDYKTDYIENIIELRERYSGQVSLYKAAVEKGLSVKVSKTLLYSLHLGLEIEV